MAETVLALDELTVRFRLRRGDLTAVPEADPEKPPPKLTLKGEVTSPVDPPPGCRLCGRCPRELPVCSQVAPPLLDVGDDRQVACHNL